MFSNEFGGENVCSLIQILEKFVPVGLIRQ